MSVGIYKQKKSVCVFFMRKNIRVGESTGIDGGEDYDVKLPTINDYLYKDVR